VAKTLIVNISDQFRNQFIIMTNLKIILVNNNF